MVEIACFHQQVLILQAVWEDLQAQLQIANSLALTACSLQEALAAIHHRSIKSSRQAVHRRGQMPGGSSNNGQMQPPGGSSNSGQMQMPGGSSNNSQMPNSFSDKIIIFKTKKWRDERRSKPKATKLFNKK